jgi:hypothetical protein
MPMLLADLAEETSATEAERLDAQTRFLARLRRTVETQPELDPENIEIARLATDYVLIRLQLVEDFWKLALTTLRKKLTGADAERVLRTHLHLFESGQDFVRMVRALWALVEQRGTTPERLDDLERAERRFEKLTTEAKQALEHRARDWRPADPERLAQGLQLAREGKTVKADEARARFRREPS